MSAHEENMDERALPRLARASWVNASRGARLTAEGARSWARAEDIEARIKEKDARALAEAVALNARKRARAGRRAHLVQAVSAHPMSAHEVKARAFRTRAIRSALTIAAPCALIAAPPWMALNGDPGALIAWPAAYAYLMWSGWSAGRERPEGVEQAEEISTPDEPKKSLFRRPKPEQGLGPNEEESAIIWRISNWEDSAAERKLHEVIPGHPVIDESGLLLPVALTGRWTKAELDAQEEQVRALLGIPDGTPTQIKLGGTADRALIRVRTRVRELDLEWTPERKGLGLDADTAEIILVDITDRILVAGMSGAGKSVVLRVLMAWALSLPNTVIAIIDVKTEGALWAHTARVEYGTADIEELVAELIAEMQEREDIMRATGQDKWEATEDRPRIVVVVDEGAEFMGWVPKAVDGVRTLAVRGRAAEIVVWWATQKPTLTGPGKGLDSMISGQFMAQICLAVNSPAEARNVLGENATGDGWHPEGLLKGGWALLHLQGDKNEPNPMRVWHMTKEHVKALASRKPWRREPVRSAIAEPDILSVALRLSEGKNGVATAALASFFGISDVEVHKRMHVHGISPEPNAFAIGDGSKVRGYRRSVIEEANER